MSDTESPALHEAIADTLLILEPESGTIGDVNRAGTSLFGYDRETLVGESIETLFAEGSGDAVTHFRELVRQTDPADSNRFDWEARDADGSVFPVEATLSGTTHDGEDVVLATVRKVQDRVTNDQDIEGLETTLQLALEGTNTGVWEWDLRTDDLFWDDRQKRLFGYGSGGFEERYEQFTERVHPEDLDDVEAAHQRGMEEGYYQAEYRVYVDEETMRWVDARAKVLYEDGEPARMVGITTDITERKEREKDLENYEILFENTSDCIVEAEFVDDVPVIRSVNAAFEDVFGYAEAAVVGRNLDEVIVPDEYDDEAESINSRAQEGERFTQEVTRATADGQREFLMHSVTFDDDSFYVVYTDITERKERERELHETKRKLEQSNEKLERFAYVASHDLQEPLRMVSSYMDLLEAELGDDLDGETQEYLEFAVDGAERMQAMIDGLLQFSRVQTRAEPFEPVDAGTVFDDTLQDLELLLEETGADVEVGALPTVTADRNQLGQVFQNLLKNAIEHGGDGVSVEVTATEREDAVEFTVADDGPGIPEHRHDDVFDIFDKGGDSDGTGIGLAVCQQIVNRHGGDIWVDSEPGTGTTFHFTIADPK